MPILEAEAGRTGGHRLWSPVLCKGAERSHDFGRQRGDIRDMISRVISIIHLSGYPVQSLQRLRARIPSNSKSRLPLTQTACGKLV